MVSEPGGRLTDSSVVCHTTSLSFSLSPFPYPQAAADGTNHLPGGTGFGLSEHVREAYGFLAHNYHPGDTIHFFGFSRGAYTARSTVGLVCRIGLLTKAGMDGFFQVYKDYSERKFQDPKYVPPLPGSSTYM